VTSILVVGASGFALEVATMLRETQRYARVAFIAKERTEVGAGGFEVAGTDDDLPRLRSEFQECFVAIGSPSLRRRVAQKMIDSGFPMASLVHRTAYVSAEIEVPPGVVVYPHATIMAGSRLGTGVLVNTNASIGHETSVGSFANVQPGAHIAGRVEIGEEAYVGIGAIILETRRVGARAIVGGGAVVTRDVAADTTVVGVPARPQS
jgi:acetyltransferase EpsM